MEGSGSDEEQFRRITSDAYFTSVNVEATLKLLQDLGKHLLINESVFSLFVIVKCLCGMKTIISKRKYECINDQF